MSKEEEYEAVIVNSYAGWGFIVALEVLGLMKGTVYVDFSNSWGNWRRNHNG